MRLKTRAMLLAAAACTMAGAAAAQTAPATAAPPPAAAPTPVPVIAAPSVRAGVEAWQAGNFAVAIGNWRPLADRGDADAQYNIAQAYFLGRGVPQNSNLAEQWYERAARQGHEEAQANYGLLLFQNGRRREAMPWIEQAANRGDPRAQYVFGTALYNGDLVPVDMARAYAMMSRAASAGLPPAISQLAAMEPHISAEDRARGTQLAAALPAAPAQSAVSASPTSPAITQGRQPATPPRTHPERPVQTAERPAPTPPRPRPERPTQSAERPATPPALAVGGRWRIQLGAFSSEAGARSAWAPVAGRLAGLRPVVVHAGPVYRLQAGPLPSRAAADQACSRARVACIPVAP